MRIDPQERDTSVDHGLKAPAAKRRRLPRIGGASLLFAVIVLGVAGANAYPSIRAFDFVPVTGKIVGWKFDQETWEANGGKEAHAREVWQSRIAYRDVQGEDWVLTWKNEIDGAWEGDEVPLLIDPEGKLDPIVDTFEERWQGPLLLFLAGMALVAFSWWLHRGDEDDIDDDSEENAPA